MAARLGLRSSPRNRGGRTRRRERGLGRPREMGGVNQARRSKTAAHEEPGERDSSWEELPTPPRSPPLPSGTGCCPRPAAGTARGRGEMLGAGGGAGAKGAKPSFVSYISPEVGEGGRAAVRRKCGRGREGREGAEEEAGTRVAQAAEAEPGGWKGSGRVGRGRSVSPPPPPVRKSGGSPVITLIN